MILRKENSSSSSVRVVAPYELTRTIRIKPNESGQTILSFFKERFPFVSEFEWARRFDNNWIHEQGVPLEKYDLTRSNQVINHYAPRVVEPSVSDSITIIDETDDWLAVFKPAPLPMHQGGRYNKNTLIYILREKGYENLRMVHRLDSVTSGVVLLAKNKQSAIELRQMFELNKVQKWYHAIVKGEVEQTYRITAPIRRKRGFVFECGENLSGAKSAVTTIIPEEVVNGATRVKCIPQTGRTHQIRLHLNYIGHPIIDDPIYGPNGDQSGLKLQNSAISLQSSGLIIDEMNIKITADS